MELSVFLLLNDRSVIIGDADLLVGIDIGRKRLNVSKCNSFYLCFVRSDIHVICLYRIISHGRIFFYFIWVI